MPRLLEGVTLDMSVYSKVLLSGGLLVWGLKKDKEASRRL